MTTNTNETEGPKGELVIKVVAMPAETNPNGDIFGGWLLAQMDLGGAMMAKQRARNRVVTIAVQGMTFLHPVQVGDFVSFYASIAKVGRTSIDVDIEAWVSHYETLQKYRVTEGIFTYVAIDNRGKPKAIA